jgi:1-acyl-sn-glycerol-3-phosphate acyltransferase
LLQKKKNTPVLPITIDSFYKIGKPLRVVFHEPIVFDAYYDQKLESEVYEGLSQEIMTRIYSELKHYKRK